jgi:hypothetical protein
MTKETAGLVLQKHYNNDIDISLHIVPPGCHCDSDEEEEGEDDADEDDDSSVVAVYMRLNDVVDTGCQHDDSDGTERSESVDRFTDLKPISRQGPSDDLPCIPRRRGSLQDFNNAPALPLGSLGDSSFSSLVE